MTKQFFAVLTNYGTQVIAGAVASKQPLKITHMAVGDGNGNAVVPTAAHTALTKETYRAAISAVTLDPRNNKQVIFELTIPESVGGFYVREMGIFDSNNKMVAMANCPESYKPKLESGSGKVQVLRMVLTVNSSDAITLTVDDSVIFVTRGQFTPKTITENSINGYDETGHSHKIDEANTNQKGITQHTNDYNGDSETLSLTQKGAKALKALIDSLTRSLNNYIPNSKKSSAVNSPSNDTVATSAAAKIAYEKGQEALNKAIDVDNSTLKKNGNQELNGILTAKNVGGAWAAYNFATNGGTWRFEAHPDPDDSSNRRLNLLFTSNAGNGIYLRFPHVHNDGDNIAYQRWVNEQIAKVKSVADGNTRNFANYIANGKKSNAVDNTSTDTVATSRAVKLAYDRRYDSE